MEAYQMSIGANKMVDGLIGSYAAGAAGAAIGGSIVSGVCAVGGSFVGPVGTFLGYTVGASVGAAVGGALGSVGGFVYCIMK